MAERHLRKNDGTLVEPNRLPVAHPLESTLMNEISRPNASGDRHRGEESDQ